jgi:hypothetical protein
MDTLRTLQRPADLEDKGPLLYTGRSTMATHGAGKLATHASQREPRREPGEADEESEAASVQLRHSTVSPVDYMEALRACRCTCVISSTYVYTLAQSKRRASRFATLASRVRALRLTSAAQRFG